MPNILEKENYPKTVTDSLPKDEIRAGLLVTAAFASLIALLFAIGNFTSTAGLQKIPILFDYIAGLEKNAPVQMAGHKVGTVSNISFLKEGKVLVEASVSKDVQLKEDSTALIDSAGLMGEKLVELSAGSPEAAPLPKGETLQGIDPVSIMKMLQMSSEFMEGFTENRSDVREIVANMRVTSENFKAFSEDIKQHPWKLIRKSDGKKKGFFF